MSIFCCISQCMKKLDLAEGDSTWVNHMVLVIYDYAERQFSQPLHCGVESSRKPHERPHDNYHHYVISIDCRNSFGCSNRGRRIIVCAIVSFVLFDELI